MSRRSTPNKRSPEREQIILIALEWGATWRAAAKLAGVSVAALDKWRRADPDFAAAALQAIERLHAKQIEALSDCEEEQ
jgi:transposase-like protein